MVEGGMKCVKYLLFIFNFIFFLAGLVLIIIGAIMATNVVKSTGLPSNLTAGAYFIIAIGCIIFVVGFFGCCGAIKENRCMLITFAVLLGIIFVLEVAAAIVAFAARGKLVSVISGPLQETMWKYGNTTDQTETVFWNETQKNLKCCGAVNATDWNTAVTHGAVLPNSGGQANSVPDSCCKTIATGCGIGQALDTSSTTIYYQGCLAALEPTIDLYLGVVGGVALGIAFIEILGIILACCLSSAVKEQYQVA